MQHRERVGFAEQLGVEVVVEVEAEGGFGVIDAAGHEQIRGVMVALGFDEAGT